MPRHPLPFAVALALLFASPAPASNCAGVGSGLVPLNDLGAGFYQGVQGGLYPGGSNHRPDPHNAAGIAIANAIVPLDTLGACPQRALQGGEVVQVGRHGRRCQQGPCHCPLPAAGTSYLSPGGPAAT